MMLKIICLYCVLRVAIKTIVDKLIFVSKCRRVFCREKNNLLIFFVNHRLLSFSNLFHQNVSIKPANIVLRSIKQCWSLCPSFSVSLSLSSSVLIEFKMQLYVVVVYWRRVESFLLLDKWDETVKKMRGIWCQWFVYQRLTGKKKDENLTPKYSMMIKKN
jgi:hypothetical protein